MRPDTPPPPSKLELFLAFSKIGVLGFGGVGPWARRVLVEETGWLTDEEWASLLGFGQILPGPNVVNASVILGDRYHGPMGSVIAVTGIMAAPMAILIAAAALYDRFEAVPDVQAGLAGVAAAAAGLVLGTSLRMAWSLRPGPLALGLGITALVAVLLGAPLVMVVLTLAPVGLALRTWGGVR
jgi:chromate transporter